MHTWNLSFSFSHLSYWMKWYKYLHSLLCLVHVLLMRLTTNWLLVPLLTTVPPKTNIATIAPSFPTPQPACRTVLEKKKDGKLFGCMKNRLWVMYATFVYLGGWNPFKQTSYLGFGSFPPLVSIVYWKWSKTRATGMKLQWNSSMTDTIGRQRFVPCSEVSLTQGLPVYFHRLGTV